MFKKIMKAAIIGASVFAMAGAANALDINIYGASAQYEFWNDSADDFLNNRGCSNVQQAADASGKHGITVGTCPEGTVYIRYSAKASYDGIRSMQGQDPDGLASSCPSGYYRLMADETQTNFGTGVVSGLACKDVTIGASDVEAGAFVQESHGQLKGHLGGGWVDRVFPGANPIDDTGLVNYRPIVVPFAFFKNQNGNSFTNMTQMMATHIFSGQVNNWQSFDPSHPSLPIVVCLRHAGSGTHATLDGVVMRAPLIKNENTLAFLGSLKYFNDGSSDMMRCVDQNTGAVGYADVDKNASGSYVNNVTMSYQGAVPNKTNVVNGTYEFWSAQWLFEDPAEPNYANTHPLVVELKNFASIPSNIPTKRAPYWAAQNEMKVDRGATFSFPDRTAP